VKPRARAIQLALLALLVGAGCAHRLGLEQPTLVATVARTPAELNAAAAPFGRLAARLRQSVLISYQGRDLLLNGLLVLDPEAGTAQLVAGQDLGPTVLALSISASGHTLLRPPPPPYDHPRLVAGVAASVRRMFLPPPGAARTTFSRESRAYRGESGEGLTARQCRLGGEPLVLLEASGQGESGPWRVTYGNYREGEGGLLPMAIVYAELEGRLRVTVWNESVER
jgi:hypothetical protein